MRNLRCFCWILVALTWAVTFSAEAATGVDRPPSVVGTGQPIQVVPDLSEAVADGEEYIWRRYVERKGATFLKPHFSNVNLPSGDTIVVRSKSGHLVEVISGRGPKGTGSFWGLSAMGDGLSIELHFRHQYSAVPFRIDEIIVGDTQLFDSGPGAPKSICYPADFEDSICYQDDNQKWTNAKASVGVMSVGSNPSHGLWCSGSNVSSENYVLTNQHCIENQGDCNTSEYVFKYYRTGCNNGSPPTSDWVSYHCDQLLVMSPLGTCEPTLDTLDFSLTSVIGDPASNFGFVQLDPNPLTDGEDIYILQHPAGRPQEITHGGGGDVVVDGHTLRYYDTLDTEAGSSGAPIFRAADGLLVGLHHCGICAEPFGNRGTLMSDIYPLIDPYVCSASLDLVAASYQSLRPVTGNDNQIIEPGETWQLKPLIRNRACSQAGLDVAAEIQVNPGSTGASIDDGSLLFGTVEAGQTVAASAPVSFAVDLAAPCGETVILDLVNLTASNGGPFADALEFATFQLGETVYSEIFFEDFSSGLGVWTVIDGGTGTGPAQTWTTANPAGRVLALTSPFAICDAAEHGSDFTMEEELISPVLDCSSFTDLELQFSHDYRANGNDQGTVEVRSDATGGSWAEVATFTETTTGTVTEDISSAAGPGLQIRFHYRAINGRWWAVDDIYILGTETICEQFGLVIFADGFESGDTAAWSGVVGSPGFKPR